MIVAKLLTVRVQPVFVLVDTETADVQPAPSVTPADLSAAQVGELAALIEQARQHVQAQLEQPTAADRRCSCENPKRVECEGGVVVCDRCGFPTY